MKWSFCLFCLPAILLMSFSALADRPDWPNITDNHQSSLVSLFSDHRQIGNGIIVNGQVLVTERTTRAKSPILGRTSDGMWYRLRLLGKDRISNLALFQFLRPKDHMPPKGSLSLSQASSLIAGEQAAILLQRPNGIVRHQTSLVRDQDRSFNWGPHDSYIEMLDRFDPNDRGAALIDRDGNLAGIFTAMEKPAGGQGASGLFIPAKTISHVLSQLQQFGRVKRGWLGIRISNLSRLETQDLGLTYPHGLAVNYVNQTSPAAAAGFKNGDILLSFDNMNLSRTRDLARLVANSRTGIPYPFRILRDGAPMTLTAVLQERLRHPLTP